MTTAAAYFGEIRLSLPRILVLNLAGAFVGLMVDIRVEHVDAVREHAVAWVPIIYSGIMALACLAGGAIWNHFSRQILLVLFTLAMFVGVLGFYFHTHGNVTKVIRVSARAWTDPEMNRPDTPPQVAPLAFAGLGAIGVLASLKRFNA